MFQNPLQSKVSSLNQHESTFPKFSGISDFFFVFEMKYMRILFTFLEIRTIFFLELLFFRLKYPIIKVKKLSKSLIILVTYRTSYFSPQLPWNTVARTGQNLPWRPCQGCYDKKDVVMCLESYTSIDTSHCEICLSKRVIFSVMFSLQCITNPSLYLVF